MSSVNSYDSDNQSISYVPVDRLEFSITFADVHRDYVSCKKCTRVSVEVGEKRLKGGWLLNFVFFVR